MQDDQTHHPLFVGGGSSAAIRMDPALVVN
jgi:hypothetical protein